MNQTKIENLIARINLTTLLVQNGNEKEALDNLVELRELLFEELGSNDFEPVQNIKMYDLEN